METITIILIIALVISAVLNIFLGVRVLILRKMLSFLDEKLTAIQNRLSKNEKEFKK